LLPTVPPWGRLVFNSQPTASTHCRRRQLTADSVNSQPTASRGRLIYNSLPRTASRGRLTFNSLPTAASCGPPYL